MKQRGDGMARSRTAGEDRGDGRQTAVRIRIDVTVPPWVKGLLAAAAVGAVLSVGAVRAGTVTVKTNWAPGDTLTAADLNANFGALKAALDGLKQSDCPEDYARDAGAAGIVLCKKGVDQMVKVGGGGAAFWIDRYETSLFAA